MLLLALLTACGSTPPRTGPRRTGDLRSPYLRATYGSIQDELEALRGAAPGLRPVAEGYAGRVGRTYRAEAFRILSGAPEAALDRMVREVLEPDPTDFTFYADIEGAESSSAASFEEALRFGDAQISSEEAASLQALTRALEHHVSSLPSHIEVYVVRAGWADAVGESHHGIVLVDRDTHEALWIHVFESWTA